MHFDETVDCSSDPVVSYLFIVHMNIKTSGSLLRKIAINLPSMAILRLPYQLFQFSITYSLANITCEINGYKYSGPTRH